MIIYDIILCREKQEVGEQMTLEEQYRLSFYKECAEIGGRDDIHLVQNIENKKFYVKKDLTVFNMDVYRRMIQIQDVRIPTIYECVETNDHLIVIEEYVHGDSLGDVIDQQGILDEEKVLDYMIKLCESVQILHKQKPPIIHRDIKPSNIIISNEGNLKLIDINIAKPYTEQETKDTILIGTKEFAAPEQYGFRQSDARTDIYAMGVTMNYLLTGTVPREAIYMGNARRIIEKCIEMDPKNRYQTVEELKSELQSKSLNAGLKSTQKREKVEQKSVCEKNWRIFLPPGFRSGNIWKMILAGFGYLMCIWISLSGQFKYNNVVLTGIHLYYNRMMFLTLCLMCIAFASNYLGVQNKLPFFRPGNKLIRGGQVALYTILIGFIWMVLLIIVEMMLWSI